MQYRLSCGLADARYAQFYDAARLDDADKRRVRQTPALDRRLDWRVSRALKQQMGLPVLSLSHSAGAAAVLSGTTGIRAGVDMEYLRPRDFAALADWVASDAERQYLAHHAWCVEDFYTWWTLKEALLKAAHLVFPADMVRVGWQWQADGQCSLQVNGQGDWHGCTVKLAEQWIASCVWQGQATLVWQPWTPFETKEILQLW